MEVNGDCENIIKEKEDASEKEPLSDSKDEDTETEEEQKPTMTP